jgi:hypothetical protein
MHMPSEEGRKLIEDEIASWSAARAEAVKALAVMESDAGAETELTADQRRLIERIDANIAFLKRSLDE